jgi:hypothetical protein
MVLVRTSSIKLTVKKQKTKPGILVFFLIIGESFQSFLLKFDICEFFINVPHSVEEVSFHSQFA